MKRGAWGGRGSVIRYLDGEPETTRRPCLRCRRDFDSVGPGNRLCDPCRARVSDASPLAP